MRSLARTALLMACAAAGALAAGPSLAQTAPPGSVIDLGTGTPPTIGAYTQYSTTVTAQTTGTYYSLFAFREAPAYFRFDDVSITAVGSSLNLLSNPGFEDGSTPSTVDSGVQIPVGWGTIYQTGTPPGAAGTVTSARGSHSGSYIWYDGSIESFDGLYQTFHASAGQRYLISFFLQADNAFSTPQIEMATYFGACDSANGSCASSFGNGFQIGQQAATIDTANGDIAPDRFSLGSAAARAGTVVFAGGTLVMQGGSFPGNVVPAPVTLSSSNGTVDTTPASGGFSGVVSGPGSLTVIGTHTFLLSGNNSYTGGTFLQGGTLMVGSDSALGSGRLAMSDGTTLAESIGVTLGNTVTVTLTGTDTIQTSNTTGLDEGLIVSGVISGTGTLVKTGASGLRLSAHNTYSGGTIIEGGHIGIGSNDALGSGTVTFAGGFLRAHTDGLTIGNAAVLSANGKIDTRGFGLTYTGAISGAGQLIKAGSGTLTLPNANTYTGGTALNNGTIAFGNAASFGGAPITVNAGTLQAAADSLTLRNDVSLQGSGTIDTQAHALTLSGAISGEGHLDKIGSGTLALTGFSTYSGGTTVTAGTVLIQESHFDGSLRFDGGSAGVGAITLDGGTLRTVPFAPFFNLQNAIHVGPGGGTIDSNDAIVAAFGGISSDPGAGPLTFTNARTTGRPTSDFVIFNTGTSTAGTIITNGTQVRLGSDGALGTGSLEVQGLGQLDLGASKLEVTRLSGTGEIYSTGLFGGVPNGVTTSARLTVQSGDFSGFIADAQTPGPVTIINSTAAYSGILSFAKASDGSASGGTLVLRGAETYSGATTVTGGTLKAGSPTALAPHSAFTVAGGATLDLGGFNATIASLAGAGTVTTTGSAATRLAVGSSNASTEFDGLLSDGAATVALIKTGSGTLTLAGANAYSGGTTILSGTIGVGNSLALGTGPVALDDLTKLQFTANGLTIANRIDLTGVQDPVIDTGGGSETISGPITGPGALTKIGSGTLDLTGTNTYTGATEVAAGTLLVDGAIVNSGITVDGGAALGGSGSIKSAVIDSGATLGLATQTLKVTSNVSFLSGSTYQVTINPDGSGSRLTLGGAASLGGARLDVLAGSGIFSAREYTLLTAAAGVSGSFGSLDFASSLALLRPQLSYGSNDVVLSLHPVDFTTVAATPNQQGTAAAIQALGPNSPLYNAVIGLDQAHARQAFIAASGVSHASTTATVASTTHLTTGLMMDRLWDVSGSGLSAQQVLDQFSPDRMPALVRCYGPAPDPVPTARAPSYTAWGEAFGTFGHTDGGLNAGPLDRSLGGFILGIDTPLQGILDDKWRGGIAGGYTNLTYDSHIDGGTGTVQGVFGSLYAGARYGAVDVRVGATVGGNFVDARRTVVIPPLLQTEKSSSAGYSVQAFGEVGYRIPAQGFVFEPIAGIAFLHSHQNGFSEKGGAAALVSSAVDDDLGTTTAGFRAEVQPFKDLPIVAHALLAWQHVIGNLSPATTLAFEVAPTNTFSVTGAPIDRDALAAELAMDYRVSAAVDIGLSYSGLVGPTAFDHSVKGRVEYRF